MTGVVLAGLLAGWAVAVPVGPVGAYLVASSARSGWRTGTAAALGVAAADGLFALAAAAGGAGLVRVVQPAAGPARWVGAAVLLGLAVASAATAVRDRTTGPVDAPAALAPRAAFARMLGLTMVNPATVLTFAALLVGTGIAVEGPGAALLFAAAVAAASAAWQLLLATCGAALGGLLTGRRGRLGTALVSSAVMAALAVALVLPTRA